MTYLLRIIDKLRSRFAVLLLLIGALTLNSLSQDTGRLARTVTLKRGQVLQMKLVKRLNSGRAQAGDEVLLRLREPVLADGETVLPKGWTIHGRIRNMKRAAKNCQPGSIDWGLEPTTMPGNEKTRFVSLRKASRGRGCWTRPHARRPSLFPKQTPAKRRRAKTVPRLAELLKVLPSPLCS